MGNFPTLPPDAYQPADPTQRDFSNAPPNVPVSPVLNAAQDQNAPPPDVQPEHPVDRMANAFIQHLLQRTPPPPQQNPTGGSFADKLSRAVNGVGTSLGDAAHATDNLRSGQGWLSGIENTVAARTDRQSKAQAEATAQSQRQQQLDLEEQRTKASIAASNAQMVHSEKLSHQVDEEAVNASIESGKTSVKAMTTAANPGQIQQEGLTSDEMGSLLAQGKLDPTSVTAFPTGRKVIGTNEDGSPQYRTTYTLITPPPQITLTDENRAALKNIPELEKLPVGTVLTGSQYNSLAQQSSDIAAATAARNKTLADNEIGTDTEAKKLEVVRLGSDWNNALSQHNNDPVAALKAMNSNPAVRQKYPHLADDVMQSYGGAKEWETIVDNQEKRQIERQKLYAEQHPAGGALGNIPQSDGLKAQIAQLTQANPSAAAVLTKFDNPTQAALMAVAFGDGSTDFDKSFPVRLTKGAPGITAQTAIGVLKQINPNFNEQQYRATTQAYKEATSGKNAQAIQQYNNFIQHSSEAVDALSETGRKGPRIFNMALNKMENAGYGTDATRIQSTLSAVRGEISLLLSGGYKPAEDEQKTINTILSDASTPSQLSAALQQYATMGTVRLDNINENYKRTTGKNLPRIIDQKTLDAAKHLGISPQAQATLNSLDSNGTIFGSQTPTGANAPRTAPAPQTHVFDSKAWAAANPGKDVNAAINAAKQQGFEVR